MTWDEALDDIAGRIRAAIVDDRRDEVMYHVGRPGRGRLRRALPARLGRRRAQLAHQHLLVRRTARLQRCGAATTGPSPDHANAKVILLLSSHLETGHYFNPHAQRIMEAKAAGTKLVVVDPRMSNTAVARRPVDRALAGQRGRDPAGRRVAPAAAPGRSTPTTCGAGSTGRPTSSELHPERRADFEAFLDALDRRLRAVHVRVRRRGGAGAGRSRSPSSPRSSRSAGTALSAHIWRSAAAGNLGGWQVARCLFFLNVLTGSVGTPGGTSPERVEQVHRARLRRARGPRPLERAALAAGVPAVHATRCRSCCRTCSSDGPRSARGLLLPRLQPDLDQPRRVHLDGGADRSRTRWAATSR